MAEIRVFNSHIEIYPYTEGDCEKLEYMLSYYDEVYHKRVQIGYYIENSILYIPRGINLMMIQNLFNDIPSIVYSCDKYKPLGKYKMMADPKNKIQEQAINFLTTSGEFSKFSNRSQLGLNLDTGDGKTYTMINAIVKYNLRAIIIVHKSRLKSQWKDEILKMTNIPENEIIDVSGSVTMDNIIKGDTKGKIYIVNHQTIESYARIHSWAHIKKFFQAIEVGIKVVDECHKFFKDILMIDFFSNTYKNFYLTATFSRGNPKEVPIFQKSFTNMCRFGEETFDYKEKRKHINLVVIYYNSKPEQGTSISNQYGFSNYKFIDYALKNDNKNTLMRVLRRILDQTSNLNGKFLITSPKIETVDYIRDYVQSITTKEVGSVYSRNTKQENDNIIKDKSIISSTIKSIGEGDNIKDLRVLINLDPIGSKNLADQLRGRLREYSPTDDTFLFYPVDVGFKECNDLFKRILPTMKRKCKSIIFMKWYDL